MFIRGPPRVDVLCWFLAVFLFVSYLMFLYILRILECVSVCPCFFIHTSKLSLKKQALDLRGNLLNSKVDIYADMVFFLSLLEIYLPYTSTGNGCRISLVLLEYLQRYLVILQVSCKWSMITFFLVTLPMYWVCLL